MSGLGRFTARATDGGEVALDRYAGQVLLVVNTASRCGFTGQYEGLEELQQRFGARGFSVLAFPCNQFAGQEPGSDVEIAAFCDTNFRVTFPVFARVEVNGANAHPLFGWLKRSRPGLLGVPAIKWNFTKFLLDRGGKVVSRAAPATPPGKLADRIEALL